MGGEGGNGLPGGRTGVWMAMVNSSKAQSVDADAQHLREPLPIAGVGALFALLPGDSGARRNSATKHERLLREESRSRSSLSLFAAIQTRAYLGDTDHKHALSHSRVHDIRYESPHTATVAARRTAMVPTEGERLFSSKEVKVTDPVSPHAPGSAESAEHEC